MPEDPAPSQEVQTADFPIVGVGASAGGMEAFTRLLEKLPAKTGMAFVLVQHLDPTHESILAALLGKKTQLRVVEAEEGMRVERGHVYVIPPNRDMTLVDGHLSLVPRMATRGRHMPVDYFFRSLAEVQGSRAIGVVLSGTGSDGTLGMKAIKAEGGITFAQDAKSAKYDGMPSSAIGTGCVDFVLSPEDIAIEMLRLDGHPYLKFPKQDSELLAPPVDDGQLKKIFLLLKRATNVDFTFYRHSTIQRRIARRMMVHKCDTLDKYVELLSEKQEEVHALYQDILIKVTRFFRDPDVFEFLKKSIFPEFLKNRPPDSPIRIWIPGCATGEEVYSIAICLLEFMSDASSNPPMQIFATDVSESAINTARDGKYLENIALDVSPERLRRFFVKVDEGFQISKPIRDMCVFARQNMISDPPFSKLDLISCRNVLIYLEPALQKRVMPLFHYALRPNGYLMLGSSETVGTFAELFSLVDKSHKVFARKATSGRLNLDFSMGATRGEIAETGRHAPNEGFRDEHFGQSEARREADRIILTRFSTAGVVIDEEMEVVQFRGDTRAYLEHAPGEPSLNLLKMARNGLGLELRALVHDAKSRGATASKSGIVVPEDGGLRSIRVEVSPLNLAGGKGNYYLVLFEDMKEAKKSDSAMPPGSADAVDRQVSQLRNELAASKHHLQAIIEEQEATNEELQSANEEILSSNEELQSINEELETAKEELQSTNEELTTVNEELQNRNSELSQVNNDLSNLLASVNIPIVMLSNDLRIRRFTQQAEKMLSLIATDVGRPIGDIKPRVNLPDMEQLVSEVIETMTPRDFEAQDKDGRWYSVRVRPYKTLENKIDGAVIAMVDIDLIKRSMDDVRDAAELTEGIVQTVREPLLILDAEFHVKRANPAFYEVFRANPAETENRLIFELGNRQWNIPRLREMLNELLGSNKNIVDYEVEHRFESLGLRKMKLNGRRFDLKNRGRMILLAIEDVTDKK